MGYESNTYYVCIIIKLKYFVGMDRNPMKPNPKYATSWWDSLEKPIKL